MLRAALYLVFAGVLGCASPVTPADAATDVPPFDAGPDAAASFIELGTGQLSWEPLRPSGNRLELIHGPQGGYHVFGRARFRGLGPDVYLSFRVTPAGGGPAINDPGSRVRLREARGLVPLGNDTFETAGAQLVILEGIRGPQEVVGRNYQLQMTVQRFESSQSLVSSAEITIIDDT